MLLRLAPAFELALSHDAYALVFSAGLAAYVFYDVWHFALHHTPRWIAAWRVRCNGRS